jgi:hypothetical protein
MASLNTYLRQVQRFLRDANQELMNPQDLIDYINQARRETAMRSQCLRVLPPISGAVTTASVTAQGAGYTAPVAVISAPDSPSGQLPFPNGAQATATVTQIAGQIVSVNITYGGSGYFQPTMTITDPTGSGAAVALTTSLNNSLNANQEVYPFNGVDLSQFPGVDSIYFVRGISIIYANYRYSLPVYSFSTYQAKIRQYSAGSYTYVPTFGAQFGQGTSGSFYLYPPPSQAYQMEWDCQCLPQDLLDDQSVEAIPDPWTDAVPFYAAHLAMIELQNWNSARAFEDRFDDRMHRFGGYTRPGRAVNPYGRW